MRDPYGSWPGQPGPYWNGRPSGRGRGTFLVIVALAAGALVWWLA